MKSYPFIFTLIFLLGAVSCKKESCKSPQSFPLVHYAIREHKGGNLDTTEYVYDSAGRLVSENATTYSYAGNIIYVNGIATWRLNNDGLVEDGFNTNQKLSYNPDKSLKSSIVDQDSTFYSYTNGNLTKTELIRNTGERTIHTYTYYIGGIQNSLGNRNFGRPYFGKSSDYVADSSRSHTVYENRAPVDYLDTEFTYILNNMGYIETVLYKNNDPFDPDTSWTQIYHYVYY